MWLMSFYCTCSCCWSQCLDHSWGVYFSSLHLKLGKGHRKLTQDNIPGLCKILRKKVCYLFECIQVCCTQLFMSFDLLPAESKNMKSYTSYRRPNSEWFLQYVVLCLSVLLLYPCVLKNNIDNKYIYFMYFCLCLSGFAVEHNIFLCISKFIMSLFYYRFGEVLGDNKPSEDEYTDLYAALCHKDGKLVLPRWIRLKTSEMWNVVLTLVGQCFTLSTTMTEQG